MGCEGDDGNAQMCENCRDSFEPDWYALADADLRRAAYARSAYPSAWELQHRESNIENQTMPSAFGSRVDGCPNMKTAECALTS